MGALEPDLEVGAQQHPERRSRPRGRVDAKIVPVAILREEPSEALVSPARQ